MVGNRYVIVDAAPRMNDRRGNSHCPFHIDRYSRNTFFEDMARFGIDPDTRLTHREWKAVRRRVSKRPRRFSRRFIASQMNERNAYRCRVRMLQHVPALASVADFPYNVPKPIRVGTVVTAYNRKFRMIHRGVVLSHDEVNARYLILFESKEFGCEYCPDSEIASHGGPELVKVMGAGRYISSLYDQSDDGVSQSLTFGSRDGTMTGEAGRPAREVTAGEIHEKTLQFAPLIFKKASDHKRDEKRSGNTGDKDVAFEDVRNEAAEREMLILLVKVADAAAKRKEILLDSVEKLIARRDQEKTEKNVLRRLRDYHVWLWANLEETNRTLNMALRYIRLMYGRAYLPLG